MRDPLRGLTSSILHGVRLLGFADTGAIADRAGLFHEDASEELLDQQAYGRVAWHAFAGSGGWSLTEAGRRENERLLAAELDAVPGARAEVSRIHDAFVPVNALLKQACTDWQLRPTPEDRLTANDHTDPAWDARVLRELGEVAEDLAGLEAALAAVLARFAGYHARFTAALDRGRIDEQVDSCHRVWFELHEDLIATLGEPRQA